MEYWIDSNKTKTYATKLNEIFNERIKLISQYPNLGKITDMKDIRVHIVKDYFLLYQVASKTIYIVSIFDTRQDPKKIKRIIRK